MHKPDIEDLLNRYWEGETTLEEERWLKDYFSTQPVPEQYRREARLFRTFRSEQSVQMPGSRGAVLLSRRFGWRGAAVAASLLLLVAAGIWWQQARSDAEQQDMTLVAQQTIPAPVAVPATPIPIPPAVEENVRPAQPVHTYKNNRPRKKETPPAVIEQPDTYEDPEKALAEIKAMLALVSSKINKSKKELGKGLQEVETLDIVLKKKKETNG